MLVFLAKISRELDGVQSVLSPLEYSVACVLWGCPREKMKVRQVHVELKRGKKKVPLTSVAVMLDRLHKKGIVSRHAEPGLGGYHYLYCAKTTQNEFEQSVLVRAVDRLVETFGENAVAYFNERFQGNPK